MEIPPCTTGKHSTTDLPPAIEHKEKPSISVVPSRPSPQEQPALPRAPIAVPSGPPTPAPPPEESEDDDPALTIPEGRVCRRRGCGAVYQSGPRGDGAATAEATTTPCVHHPGAPIFHEGSKGYTCCRRRVLEFDEFMKLEGCETKPRHLFVGSGRKEKTNKTKKKGAAAANGGTEEGGGGPEDWGEEEILDSVRWVFLLLLFPSR